MTQRQYPIPQQVGRADELFATADQDERSERHCPILNCKPLFVLREKP